MSDKKSAPAQSTLGLKANDNKEPLRTGPCEKAFLDAHRDPDHPSVICVPRSMGKTVFSHKLLQAIDFDNSNIEDTEG